MVRPFLRAACLAGVLALPATTGSAAAVEELVSFTTHDGYPIQCILSYPEAGGERFPGMLLLPGSGLHDADVTLDVPTLGVTRGKQTLFKPLAQHFSRLGWAVLRCNKRGASFGHSEDRSDLLDSSTLGDLVDDAERALTTLHSHPRVTASPLVVYGHSEGAWIAARIAERTSRVDLLVLVGSAAWSTRSLLEYQLVDRNLRFFRQAVDTDGDGSLALEELQELDGDFGLGSIFVYNSAEILFDLDRGAGGAPLVRGLSPETDRDANGELDIDSEIEPELRNQLEQLLTLAADGSLGRYWQSLIRARPLGDLIQQVEVPILFVHGELDLQVPLDDPLSLMALLEASGHTSYELLVVPQVGHSLSRPNDTFRGDGGLSLLDNLTFNPPSARTRRLVLQKIEEMLGL